MAEDGKVVFKIEGDASQAMQAVDKFESYVKTGSQRVEAAVKKSADAAEEAAKDSSKGAEEAAKEAMTNTENTVMASADKIATALGAAFAAKKIMDFGKYSVGVASDLSEVQNVVDTTFGQEGAQKINEWAMSAAEMFGESELQAKQFTSTIGAMFKSMGLGQKDIEEMSIGIAGLAGDMASFYNLDPTEAFEKLRAGISGETEPLKQLGINMSVVNLEAYAMTQGIKKSYDEMTQAEQATLRYQYIMQATADAQGDFSKTSDSFANQTRILKLEMETLAAEIGQDLMPVALELVEAARDAIQWGTDNKEVLEAVGGAVVALTAGYIAMKTAMSAKSLFDEVTSSIKGIATAGGDAKTSVGNLAGAFEGLPGYAGIAVAAIGLIITALEELQDAQEEALDKQLEYMDSFTTFADYQANGLVDASGRVNYAKAEQMQAAGTFKKADTTLGASAGRTFYENSWGNLVPTSGTTTSGQSWNLSTRAGKEAFVNIYGGSMTGSRHQAGEDFVMSDWTPAFLDYGERVLTHQENLAYTAMGGVEGMTRTVSEPATTQQQQKVDFSVGFKVEPRGAAHFLAPYIVEEFKRKGWK